MIVFVGVKEGSEKVQPKVLHFFFFSSLSYVFPTYLWIFVQVLDMFVKGDEALLSSCNTQLPQRDLSLLSALTKCCISQLLLISLLQTLKEDSTQLLQQCTVHQNVSG